MTTEETGYNVTVNGHKIKAMCALDALVISPMFGYEVEIETKCYVTGEPIVLEPFTSKIAAPANMLSVYSYSKAVFALSVIKIKSL